MPIRLSKLVFCAALLCLLGCNFTSKEDLPRLLKELKSAESKVRNQAAMSIATLGEDGADAVPALIQALGDPNGGVRSSAAYALRKIGTPAATKALDDYNKRPNRSG